MVVSKSFGPLLIVAPLLGEGYLCIIVASPLFYLVGIIVGRITDHQRKKRNAALTEVRQQTDHLRFFRWFDKAKPRRINRAF